MYNSQTVIERVQSEIKKKNITQKTVLRECGLGEDTLKRMTDKNGMSSFNLARIADYLNCSIDYLLGRTENPIAHKSANVVFGDLSNNSGIVGNVGGTINGTVPLSTNAAAMLEIFNSLDTLSQAELLVHANKLKKGE